MNCIACELIRAKLKANLLNSIGWTTQAIAEHLTSCYGENYYVDKGIIYRANKLHPYKAFIVLEVWA